MGYSGTTKITTALVDDVYVSGSNLTSDSIYVERSWDPHMHIKLTSDPGFAFEVEPLLQIHVSKDDTTWHNWGGRFYGTRVAGGEMSYGAIQLPPAAPYFRVYVASGSLYGVTARVDVTEIVATNRTTWDI